MTDSKFTRRDLLKASAALAVIPPVTILAFEAAQPRPITLFHERIAGSTVVVRQWRPGDPERCNLCTTCGAHNDICVIVAARTLADHETPLYGLKVENA